MTRLLDRKRKTIRNSKTILSFETTGDDNWKVWDRFIAIEGKFAYHIGNICGTCQFFFEKLVGAKNIYPKDTIEEINKGITTIDKKVLKTIKEIIPNGKYEILLIETYPKLTDTNTSDDYFTNEQPKLWGDVDYESNVPNVKYYRGIDQEIGKESKIFEFIVPLSSPDTLNNDRVEYYKEKINNGDKPTAISLGILDIKQPAVFPNDIEPKITEHWCLANYLIDGHHKIQAAHETKKPITILIFLATDKGVSSKRNIKELIKKYGAQHRL